MLYGRAVQCGLEIKGVHAANIPQSSSFPGVLLQEFSHYQHKQTGLHLSVAYRLDESLLRGDLQHVVQLEAWGGGLLFGRPIVAFSLPLTPSHHQEDEQPNQGNESHASHNWPNNQGQLFT